MFESEEFPGTLETDVAVFVDPRTNAQGVRILCSGESFLFDDDDMVMQTDPRANYDIYRMAIGLLEGSKEMGN